jgi:uncharacterized protein (DUF433 family)
VIDWSQCPDVESVPDRCGGAWVVKDSRVIVESCILDNAEAGASPEEIADWFEVPGGVDAVRRILAFAATEADPETIYLQPICDAARIALMRGYGARKKNRRLARSTSAPNSRFPTSAPTSSMRSSMRRLMRSSRTRASMRRSATYTLLRLSAS